MTNVVTPWSPEKDQENIEVAIRVERLAKMADHRVWVGTLEGDDVPEALAGETVVYAPNKTDGFLAATVGNQTPFVIEKVALGRVVSIVRPS